MCTVSNISLLTVRYNWFVPCDRISTDIGVIKLYIECNITSLLWHILDMKEKGF